MLHVAEFKNPIHSLQMTIVNWGFQMSKTEWKSCRSEYIRSSVVTTIQWSVQIAIVQTNAANTIDMVITNSTRRWNRYSSYNILRSSRSKPPSVDVDIFLRAFLLRWFCPSKQTIKARNFKYFDAFTAIQIELFLCLLQFTMVYL